MLATAVERRSISASVRPYRPEDREAVRRIYADTAFFGEPVETYFDDRELFADLGVAAYLRCFPQYVFVADSDEGVCGYILGCPTGDVGIRKQVMVLLPGILTALACRRYRLGRKSLLYGLDNLWVALRGELIEVHDRRYPANLHINVAAGRRGQGLGSALLDAYLEKLRSEGIAGVHLVTTELNQAAVRLYRRHGFELLTSRPSRLWYRYLGRELQLLAFGLTLAQP